MNLGRQQRAQLVGAVPTTTVTESRSEASSSANCAE